MEKIKATKQAMKDNHRILKIGYCKAQYLLNYHNPIAYSGGSYGWSCDYYDVNGVVISTGYSPLNNKNMQEDYELIEVYENQARELVNNNTLKWEERKEQVNNLLYELIEKLKVL